MFSILQSKVNGKHLAELKDLQSELNFPKRNYLPFNLLGLRQWGGDGEGVNQSGDKPHLELNAMEKNNNVKVFQKFNGANI